MSPVHVKICGMTTPETVAAALELGVAFVGFMSFPKSPRHIEPTDAAPLAAMAKGRAKTVSVVVDPDPALIESILTDLKPDYIQFHGSESPEFCAQLRARGVGVIKAFGISVATDLDQVGAYEHSVDMVLFDAKPPPDADRTGGLGHVFDWSILQNYASPVPWFLAGGLNAENVADAIAATSAKLLDVSSGVESARGLKDIARMGAFMDALKTDA